MTSPEALISVILPVRNGDAALLRLALASVRQQTLPDYEVLLVDDGSEEAFARVLDGLVEDDPKIRLFHKEAGGVSAARNFALTEVKGKVITFLDADDVLSPVCFEEALTLLQDPSVDAVWGGTRYFTDAERPLLPAPGTVKALSLPELQSRCVPVTPARLHQSRAEVVGEPLRFEGGGYINRGIAARFLRQELFAGGRHAVPPGLRMYEDTIWNLELLGTARVVLVKSVWYYYYENPASASNRFQPGFRQEMETALKKTSEHLDLRDPVEYAAWTRFLMDSLRYVYRCHCGHPAWRPAPQEKQEEFCALYHADPWREISTPQYRRAASDADRRKALLYRLHLLFAFWRMKT